MTEERRLAEIISRIIDLYDEVPSISPTWVAAQAMSELDPDRVAPMLVHAGCNLHLRQLARARLRHRYESESDDKAEHDLFPGLQRRYPTARSARTDEPEYVLLERLTDFDLNFNVARLEAEAVSKQKHADALRIYGRERAKPGVA